MKTLAKIGSVIIGVLFILSGITALICPMETLFAVSRAWATLFCVAGVISIITYFSLDKQFPVRTYFIVKGIIQLLIGFILVSNGVIFTTFVVLNLFQFWIIFSGVEGLISCFDLKNAGFKYWWISLIFGILSLLVGFSFSTSAIVGTSLVATSFALGMISSGILVITKGFNDVELIQKDTTDSTEPKE